jgi:hypothetical protein
MASPRSASPPRARAVSPNSHHQPIPEATLRNIDLGGSAPATAPSSAASSFSSSSLSVQAMQKGGGGGGGGKKGPADLEAGGSRRPPPAAAGGGGENEGDMAASAGYDGHREEQQQHHHQQQQRASSRLALVLAQCKRFDVELAAVFLAGILVTTACAIFTKDEGWFRLEAPLHEPVGSVGATVVYTVGLSTYTAQAHAVEDPALVLYTHRGHLDEASTTAKRIAYALYAFLVLSLVSAAGILWYIALFHGYFKSPEVNRGREAAIRCLGLQAFGLGLALLSLGTAAFRGAVAEAFVRRPFPNADASPFNDVDTAGRRLETQYAYHLTGLTWFLWLLVGGVLLFRSCCWAKRGARRGDWEAEVEVEGAGAHV